MRRAMFIKPKVFKRTPKGAESDVYTASGYQMSVYYTPHGAVEALEFSDMAPVIMDDFRLSGRTRSEVKSFMSKLETQMDVQSDSLVCPTVGVSFWFPFQNEDDDSISEAVLMAMPNYFKNEAGAF